MTRIGRLGADASPPAGAAGNCAGTAPGQQDEVIARIGQLTRNLHESLHESLHELGMGRMLERAAQEMPTARERLAYVAAMTEQAAQRVLTATEAATPLQHQISADATDLAHQWQLAISAPFSDARYRALAEQTISCLDHTRDAAQQTREHLLAIMMAQDFQDLTGQVIKKVTEVAHDVERQLVQLLVDFAPEQVLQDGAAAGSAGKTGNRQHDQSDGLLNGPQINPAGKVDVVADQKQVDDLLADLGF